MKIRRINLFGGPCSGKSSTAGWLFDELKRLKKVDGSPSLETDWVQEGAKEWTYLDRPPIGWSDQHDLFNTELRREDIALRKLDVVVCDAPLIMNCFYGWKHNRNAWRQNVQTSMMFENDFPSLNIFLQPDGIPYQSVGRFHNEKEARAMHTEVLNFVAHYHNLELFKTSDRAAILKYVIDELVNSGYSITR